MNLSQHAKTRMIQRSKIASYMKPSELNVLIESAIPFDKTVRRNHGFRASYYLIESLDLVLVVNPEMYLIVTCYKRNS